MTNEKDRRAHPEGLRPINSPSKFMEEFEFMYIQYQDIILRDTRESDIADDIRWNTEETEWALWDAPWEMEEELKAFDPEAYRAKELKRLAGPRPDHRLSLEVETASGVHIGSVSTYALDENLEWKERVGEEDHKKVRWAVGIDINDPAYWSGGWGTKALTAYIRYHLDAGYTDLYTQTWSGNVRMVGLAKKLGFRECRRKEGIRLVRGKAYDGLTFQLDRDAFEAHCRRAAPERGISEA